LYIVFTLPKLHVLVKIKSIKEIEHSTQQVTVENERIEKQLLDTKSRINEVREDIVRYFIT